MSVMPHQLVRSRFVFVLPILLGILPSCSEDGTTTGGSGMGGASGGGGGSSRASGGGMGMDDIEVPVGGPSVGGSSTGSGGASSVGGGVYVLPDDYVEAEKGGYKAGMEIEEDDDLSDLGGESSNEGCGSTILGIVRDFRRGDETDGHPDFQTYTGTGETGIVEDSLGDDRKPVLAPGDHEFVTTEEGFYQWYNTHSEVNRAYLTYLSFEPNGDVLTFESKAFFPVDGMGFGNQGFEHNFSFTTEVHTEFVYRGGESFGFLGDDDLWVFINGQLAIDLGGLHPPRQASVRLDEIADEFGLELGETYPLELFHAERHTNESNFRVDTNLEFTNCGIVVPEVR